MPKGPSLASVDKALVSIGLLASKSTRLAQEEKDELSALVKKAGKTGKLGLKHGERAHMIFLIRKAGPEKLPNVEIPEWLKRLLRKGAARDAPALPALPASDPLERLEKLGGLRGKPLTEDQFHAQRARILADPQLAAHHGGADPLDRLERVARLQEREVLTAEQAAEVTEKILSAG